MLEVGDSVEHYRVEGRLPPGGSAAGYRVRDLQAGSLHTLKVLVGTSSVDRDRILAESQIQTRLRHPNLVGVTDVFLVRGVPALVTEPVDGPTLEGWLAEGRISVDIALAMFRGIVTGIGVAHAVGLVHRSLKPTSVLLGRGRSGALVAKVTDFGIVAPPGRVPSRYLAPEQLRDPELDDPRVDLWALGCVLYELVCGVPAFTAADPAGLRKVITAGRYPDPQALLAPRSPSRVTEVIHSLLIPDPDARIESCSALWQRLWDTAVPRELTAEVTQPLDDLADPDPMDATHVWEGPDGADDDGAEVHYVEPVPADVIESPNPLDAPITLVPPEEIGNDPPGSAGAGIRPPDSVGAGIHDRPWPLHVPQVQADWLPTPSAVDRRPPVPVVRRGSRWWYVGAILAAGLPAGLFAVVVSALVVERTGPDLWWVLPQPSAGQVSVDGDATAVWLEAGDRQVPVDRPVPAGRYTVRATWADGIARDAGVVDVASGAETRLHCVSFACVAR